MDWFASKSEPFKKWVVVPFYLYDQNMEHLSFSSYEDAMESAKSWAKTHARPVFVCEKVTEVSSKLEVETRSLR